MKEGVARPQRGRLDPQRGRLNPLRGIALGFAGLILLGCLLLSLPCASRSGRSIGGFDALFTSASAVCVTGLTIPDTASSFSLFGRTVLLCLIQIGGLGFMTFAALLFRLIGRRISLKERLLIREALNEEGVGSAAELIGWAARNAFAAELLGAALLSLRFVPRFGLGRGIFYSIFHSISAFCNAGFDLLGDLGGLSSYRSDVLVNLTLMTLIVVGGLGFGVLRDLKRQRGDGYLRLNTRIVLSAYGILLLFGMGFTLLSEWSNPLTLGALPFGEKLLAAAFHSVSLRTAGFSTIDVSALRPACKLTDCLLMLIGAAPASTGGGVKVTTVAVILLCVLSTARGRSEVTAFRRSISPNTVRRALAVLLIAVSVWLADAAVISLMQPELELADVLFECASAMGTVGLSALGTARLRALPRALLIFTMYIGRIGPLSAALALAKRQSGEREMTQYPRERIMIG